MLKYIKNIIQLIISPDNGWEDISQTSSPKSSLQGMVWMILIASFSVFVQLFYSVHPNAMALVQMMVALGVSYSVTYFIADFVLSSWLPKINDGVVDSDKYKIFVSYSIGLLTVQNILTGILPLSFAILELWFIYVVVIMWRAMKILDIEQRQTGKFLLVVILSIILPSQVFPRFFYSIIMQ